MNLIYNDRRFKSSIMGLILCVLISSCSTIAPTQTLPKNEFESVMYVYNYDADTITVTIPNIHPYFGYRASVRVAGIDTPEIGGDKPCEKEFAKLAKAFVQSKLSGALKIDLKNLGREKYGRILADVFYNSNDLKNDLINVHMAVPYDGGTKLIEDWCPYMQRHLEQRPLKY